MVIEVYDLDKGSKTEFMGWLSIPTMDAVAGIEKKWFPLRARSGEKEKKEGEGEVCVSVAWHKGDERTPLLWVKKAEGWVLDMVHDRSDYTNGYDAIDEAFRNKATGVFLSEEIIHESLAASFPNIETVVVNVRGMELHLAALADLKIKQLKVTGNARVISGEFPETLDSLIIDGCHWLNQVSASVATLKKISVKECWGLPGIPEQWKGVEVDGVESLHLDILNKKELRIEYWSNDKESTTCYAKYKLESSLFAKTLKYSSVVKTLDFHTSGDFSSDHKKIIESLKGNQSIETLNIHCTFANANKALSELFLGGTTNIKNLDCGGSDQGCDRVAVCSAASQCASILMYNCSFASSLMKSISDKKVVTSLQIRESKIDCEMDELFQGKLETAMFYKCSFTSFTGFRNLATDQNMTTLILNNSGIGHEGVLILCEALKKNTALRELGLASNEISGFALLVS